MKPTVTGIFKGNGKDAKLACVSAHWREPFADKSSIVLVFTEKDHSKDKKPDFNAGFGKFGSALVVRCTKTATSLAVRWRTARLSTKTLVRSARFKQTTSNMQMAR